MREEYQKQKTFFTPTGFVAPAKTYRTIEAKFEGFRSILGSVDVETIFPTKTTQTQTNLGYFRLQQTDGPTEGSVF